jgi:uncharacterized protein (TIGR03083 family)
MDPARLLACLDADYRRLREVAGGDTSKDVPSCPGWTVADLLYHLAEVYLHKAECIKLGKAPEPWPPDLKERDPREVIDEAYAGLVETFAAHEASDPAFTWYEPDQTVGFWIRRMAQETVIHRRDAELAFGSSTPAEDDLADDGIDELLDIFVGWGTTNWAHEVVDELRARDGDTILVGGRLVTASMDGIRVERGLPDAPAALRVSGSPSSLLFWLWNRSAPSDAPVTVDGDQAVAERFRETLTLSTQ